MLSIRNRSQAEINRIGSNTNYNGTAVFTTEPHVDLHQRWYRQYLTGQQLH